MSSSTAGSSVGRRPLFHCSSRSSSISIVGSPGHRGGCTEAGPRSGQFLADTRSELGEAAHLSPAPNLPRPVHDDPLVGAHVVLAPRLQHAEQLLPPGPLLVLELGRQDLVLNHKHRRHPAPCTRTRSASRVPCTCTLLSSTAAQSTMKSRHTWGGHTSSQVQMWARMLDLCKGGGGERAWWGDTEGRSRAHLTESVQLTRQLHDEELALHQRLLLLLRHAPAGALQGARARPAGANWVRLS